MSRLHPSASTRHTPGLARTNNMNLKGTRFGPLEKSTTPKITIKSATSESKSASLLKGKQDRSGDFDTDDEMATSFLQYCAMCEKQIIVPNSKILYCSESCRRGDATVPLSDSYLALGLQPRTSPTQSLPAFLEHASSLDDLLPRYAPMPARGLREARIPPVQHEGGSDLDPTEWKPAEAAGADKSDDGGAKSATVSGRSTPSLATSWKPKLVHRPSSEAFTYLSSFHRSSDSMGSVQRRAARRTARTTPSLSYSPTLSSAGSEESLGAPYEVIGRSGAASLPTTAVTKTVTAAKELEEGLSLIYEKKEVGEPTGTLTSAASGSLKKLLGAKRSSVDGKL